LGDDEEEEVLKHEILNEFHVGFEHVPLGTNEKEHPNDGAVGNAARRMHRR
jgi:hypothetical protein